MKDKSSPKKFFECCEYCGWKFPDNFFQIVSENNDSAFCENCGTEISVGHEELGKGVRKNQRKYGGNKKRFNFNRVYETIRNKKDPVDRVIDDSDFPLIFKENLIIVISRLIFTLLKGTHEISNTGTNKEEIPKEMMRDIEVGLEPVINKRINSDFLVNLHKISKKEFENHLKRLQAKIQVSSYFRQDFKNFIQWLIEKVLKIASYSNNIEDLPKIDRILLKDIRKFNLDIKITSKSVIEKSPINDNIEKYLEKPKSLKVQQINDISEAAFYLKKIILPDLIEKNLTVEGYVPAKMVLINNGYYSFISVIKRNNLNYGDILKCADLKIKIKRKGRWSHLIYNSDTGEALPKNEALNLVKSFFKDTLLPDLIKGKKINKGDIPTLRDVDDSAFSGFKHVLKMGNLRLTYNEFLNYAGFKENVDKSRWSFLIKDKTGRSLTKKDKVQVAADYFKKIIIPDLIDKGIIEKGETPFRDILSDNGYSGFLNHVNYNNILKEAGFKLNLNRGNWDFLDKDEGGILLSRDEQIDKASGYFERKIIPYLIQKKIIEKDQSPTQKILRNTDHRNFLDAIHDRNLSYNEILNYIGLDLNYDPNKWRFLFFNSMSKHLSYEQTLQIASEYFRNTIIPDLVSKKKLKLGLTPTKRLLKQHGHMGMINSLYDNRKILYNELIEAVGLNPNDLQEFQKIGTDFHNIAERIFLQHTRTHNCISFNEILPSPNNVFHKNSRSDNTILIDENFKKLSKIAYNFKSKWNNIDIIHIDYFLGASEAIILDHCLRGYQGVKRLLICVSLNALEPLTTPENIPFKNNVIVLDPKTFVEFFGYDKKLRQEFLEYVQMAQMATIKESLRGKLEDISNESKSIINLNYRNSQSEFVQTLKKLNKMELIKNIGDGSRITDYV
jgi:hypothetical protein